MERRPTVREAHDPEEARPRMGRVRSIGRVEIPQAEPQLGHGERRFPGDPQSRELKTQDRINRFIGMIKGQMMLLNSCKSCFQSC
jgi:hypothetical protein